MGRCRVKKCVYKVPCANCDKTYIGETGRKFGVRLHSTEVESKTRRTLTRSHRASSLTEHNKSALRADLLCSVKLDARALTDHATQENHVINGSQAMVIDREPERLTRWIKEAVHIRKEGQQAMNHDEGSYQLIWDGNCGFGITLAVHRRPKTARWDMLYLLCEDTPFLSAYQHV